VLARTEEGYLKLIAALSDGYIYLRAVHKLFRGYDMFNTLTRFRSNYTDVGYTVFRIITGLLFVLHGLMKFGIPAGFKVPPGLMLVAGIIEVIGGVMIILGLLTWVVAGIAAIEMVAAYFMAHASTAISPLVNKGEPAVLFFAAFVFMFFYGSGRYSLDAVMKRR
jgi:putative oxidoreductase